MTTKVKFRSSQKKKKTDAIDSLKKNKASDNNGIRAEDVTACSEKTKEMMR